MPRDSGGNYALPSSYLAITGETITALQHNSPLEDIAEALTNSLPRNGSGAMTGDLPLGGNDIKNVGDIALATMTASGAVTFNGAVEFNDDVTIDAELDMASNKIVGLANGVDDSDGATVYQAQGYLTFATGSVSSGPSLSIDLSGAIAEGYRRFRLWLRDAIPETDGDGFGISLSVDGGSNYLGSGILQEYRTISGSASGSQGSEADIGDDAIFLAIGLSNSAGDNASFVIDFYCGSGNSFWSIAGFGTLYSGTGSARMSGSGSVNQAVNAIRLATSLGSDFSASYILEGYR